MSKVENFYAQNIKPFLNEDADDQLMQIGGKIALHGSKPLLVIKDLHDVLKPSVPLDLRTVLLMNATLSKFTGEVDEPLWHLAFTWLAGGGKEQSFTALAFDSGHRFACYFQQYCEGQSLTTEDMFTHIKETLGRSIAANVLEVSLPEYNCEMEELSMDEVHQDVLHKLTTETQKKNKLVKLAIVLNDVRCTAELIETAANTGPLGVEYLEKQLELCEATGHAFTPQMRSIFAYYADRIYNQYRYGRD